LVFQVFLNDLHLPFIYRSVYSVNDNLIQNSPAVKKGAAPKNAVLWNPKWRLRNGCDCRLKAKILIMTIQVNLCWFPHVSLWFSTTFTWIVVIKICDWACENRACGHMKFDYFFTFSRLITFCHNKLWSWNFQHLLNVYLAIQHKLQNANIVFHYWVMTCNVIGCSLCPHALFLQAQSHFCL